MRDFVRDGLEKAESIMRECNDNTSEWMRDQERIHYMLILLTSQQVRDELQYESYIEVIRGRFSSCEMLAPLKNVSFFRVYNYYGRLLTRYSMQMKKSESIIANLMVLYCRFGDKLTESSIQMQGLKEFGKKKTAITQKACGLYAKVGLGPGADTHLLKLGQVIIGLTVDRRSAYKPQKKHQQEVVNMFRHIPPNPGKVANDLLGEIGQQYLRGDKQWSLRILEEVMAMQEDNENVVRHWLVAYRRKFRFYKFELEGRTSRSYHTFFENLYIWSSEELKKKLRVLNEYSWNYVPQTTHQGEVWDIRRIDKAIVQWLNGLGTWERKDEAHVEISGRLVKWRIVLI